MRKLLISPLLKKLRFDEFTLPWHRPKWGGLFSRLLRAVVGGRSAGLVPRLHSGARARGRLVAVQGVEELVAHELD